jgi:hypothetical protein
MGRAQCEAYCPRIDEIAAFKGQPDVDMVSWLPGLVSGWVGPLPPVRRAILRPLSGFHVLVDVGKVAGVPVYVNGRPG